MNSKIVALIALIAVLLGCVSAEVQTIKLHLNEGSSQWWIAVDPRDELYDTVQVDIREAGDSRWTPTFYTSGWPYFATPSTSGRGFALPLSFRLTADNGQQVIANISRISGGALIDTNVQYIETSEVTSAPATQAPTQPAVATQAPTQPAAATQAPTQAATQAPTTAPTNRPSAAATTRPTQPATQAPTVAPTQPATQAPTVAPTQPATQAPTVRPTQPATQAPTAAPTQPATQAPTVAPTQPATQAPTVRPTQPATQAPTQAPTRPATQAPTQAPTRPATQAPTAAPTQPVTQAPTVRPTQPATQAPTLAPTQPATQAPTVRPTQPATQAPSVDLCAIVPVNVEPVKILVPLYVYPGAAWDSLIAAAKNGAKIIAIVNPASGPKSSGPDAAYTSYMKKFQDAGIEMVGYVHTTWGGRSISDVISEINIWGTKYVGVKGIFFDEASTESKDVAYYRQAYNAVLAQGFVHSILNPGTQPDKQYLDISTNIVIFENYAYALATTTFDSWIKCAPSAAQKSGYQYKFSAIIHTASQSQMPALIAQARNMGMGLVYVTDGPGGCCTYNYLNTYFAAQAASIKQLNSN